MKEENLKVGQIFICPSDNTLREIVSIDKYKVTLQCLNCTWATKALSLEIDDFLKRIRHGIFKLENNDKIKEEIKKVVNRQTIIKENIIKNDTSPKNIITSISKKEKTEEPVKTERHNDGNIYKSIEANKVRFNLDPQIVNIFINTALLLKWKK